MNISISNFIQYNEWLASGSRPKTEQIQELKNNGFEVVLNILPLTAKNPLADEDIQVKKAGMKYQHLPLDYTNVIPELYELFKSTLNSFSGEKTFVHCGGNIYSSNLVHMYLVLEKEMTETESSQYLLKIHKPTEIWINYFKSFGMIGI
jgi:protein tyrosine phosphatase (PTP) superfamily phosphohydrolase (DUF442 family)